MTHPRSLRLSLALFGAATFASLAPTHLSAQLVEAGIARDAKRGTPLECLHVALLDATGHAVQHTVTDAKGQFQLEATRPGAYRVQFLIYRWEPLVGPVDTLAEGTFNHRAYPLDFTNMLIADTSSVRQEGATKGRDNEEKVKQIDELLRTDESYDGWQSRRAMRFAYGMEYPPDLFTAGVSGSVLARFIVEPTGLARRDSWLTLFASHPQFENAVRGTLSDARWMPAQNAGQAVCELVMDFTRFYTQDKTGNIVMVTR